MQTPKCVLNHKLLRLQRNKLNLVYVLWCSVTVKQVQMNNAVGARSLVTSEWRILPKKL